MRTIASQKEKVEAGGMYMPADRPVAGRLSMKESQRNIATSIR